ncbi:ExbD/TolR family protein [Thermodesulfobacterium hveragerdense]|uniref:ExbD/TolR family protein n=1 Tax=Thermodesulfobacterium hveragerdense TaxID=53424 RepID=UPI0003FC399A|nr:biopolymer transporter ExbD [Thermodesulfobacterium hveragerdense]
MEEKEFDYINVIPLVDIMLVLLTIVLVTATFIVQGSIPVNLPKAKNVETSEIRSYQITLTKEGEVFFEGRKVTLKELEDLVGSLKGEVQVSILADRSSQVQGLVDLLDLLKKHEIKRVSIKTEVVR